MCRVVEGAFVEIISHRLSQFKEGAMKAASWRQAQNRDFAQREQACGTASSHGCCMFWRGAEQGVDEFIEENLLKVSKEPQL